MLCECSVVAVVLGVVAVVFGVIAEVFGTVAFVLGAVVRFSKNTLVPTKKTEIILILKLFSFKCSSVHKVISLFRRSGCTLKNPHWEIFRFSIVL